MIACGTSTTAPALPAAATSIPSPQPAEATIPPTVEGVEATLTLPLPTERIEFEPGSNSATRQGDLPPNGDYHFVLYALEGQTITINSTATGDSGVSVGLGVVSPGGAAVIREIIGGTHSSGPLPESGDYRIDLVNLGQGTVTYTLEIIIPPY
jgi:hypothetical protein